ncbi:MAG: glycosyltransferase [Gemmatimonadaceae bacterium]|nr:glycosyltransferase [Gemmatimonadaceae bacterium]
MTQRIDIWVESAGLGHVTRQINLCAHLAMRPGMQNLTPRFLVDDNPATQLVLARSGQEFSVRDPDVSKAFRALHADWSDTAPALFILDSVSHDLEGASGLALRHASVPSVVFIDDPSDRDVSCDLLVNALPTLGNPAEKRRARRAVRGVEYLVLPPEFSAARSASSSKDFSECSTGFAFFGGADLENFSAVFVDAITQRQSGIQWRLLLGPSYAHSDNLAERIAAVGRHVEVVRYVPSMAAQLAGADIVVLAAGNTLSEAAAVGAPAIVLSQNSVQAENAHFFAVRTGVVDCGSLVPDSAERLAQAIGSIAGDAQQRRAMSGDMMKTVDGEGGRRIAGLVDSLVHSER